MAGSRSQSLHTYARSLLLALGCLILSSTLAHAGDPLRVWRTIESEHFVIHYYEPLGPNAKRVAAVAERSHQVLAPLLDHEPTEKCQVLLVDDVDGANGFAGVLPRNSITLFATAPTAGSVLSDHDDWLFGLVLHEYTHILHLDTIKGLPAWYNKIFGKTWAPNQILPRWIIEGLATYEESKRTAGGRTRATIFDMYLRASVLAHQHLRLDQVSGNPIALPRGNAAYLHGSHFLRYIFDRFGDDKVRDMSHQSAGYPVPFAINRQISKTVGVSFDSLYDDWTTHVRDKYALQAQAIARKGVTSGEAVTTASENNLSPRVSKDNQSILWFQSDGRSRAKVRSMPLTGDARQAVDVFASEALGLSDYLPDGGIVYEQTAWYRRDYTFQDLYWWDKRTGTNTRLTTGMRARDPAVSPNGREIAFSKNAASQSVLAVMPFAPEAAPRIVWKGEQFDQAYQPAWSPDGKHIAFSAWRAGGWRDILVVEVASGKVQEVTHDRAQDNSPAYSPDGKWLYFESDRSGVSNVYAFDLATQQTWQVTNVIGGAFEPASSQDDKQLVFHSFNYKGNNIHRLAIDRSRWIPAVPYVDDRPNPVDVRTDEVQVTEPREYRPLESLAPQAYTVQTQLGTIASSLALQVGGIDTVGLHGYTIGLGLALDRGDVNIGAGWGYARNRNFLRVAGNRSIIDRSGFRIDGVNQPYREEQWNGSISIGIPAENRAETGWSVSAAYDIDFSRVVEAPMLVMDPNQRVPRIPDSSQVQSGVSLRGGFGSIRGWTFGIGPQRGWDANLSVRLDHPALGATFKNLTVGYAMRTFLRMPFGKSATLALRANGSVRTGDLTRTGSFSVGGIPAQDIPRAIIESSRFGSTGFLRGYESRVLTGNQLHQANVELRSHFAWVERGFATLPLYLRRLHGGVLLDAAATWDSNPSRDKIRVGVGGALRLDLLVGYYVGGTLEIGYARGLASDGISETWLRLTGGI